jgi:two-component system, NarL family, response regulator DevR
MTQPLIRIAIIDDHEMVRKGLRSFLDLEQDLVVVGDAETLTEALKLVERTHPHLVLLDLKLPDASVAESCRQLLALAPQLRILILTSYAEENAVVGAIKSGAHGYTLKDVRPDELIRAVRTVAAGRGYLDPRITKQTLHWIKSSPTPYTAKQGMAQLSPQEQLIMPLLAEGKTNKEIALCLRLSDKTVKNYLTNIFDKLHIKRRTEAVAWFVKTSRENHSSRNPG